MQVSNHALILLSILEVIICLPMPFNQYSYVMARNKLKSKYEHHNKLTYKENIVSFYMQTMKLSEFKSTNKYFYPSRPIESELEKIVQRDLYKLLWRLPKGGNLHIHQTQMLDRNKFLRIVFDMAEFDLLFICDKESDSNCTLKKTNCTCLPFQLKYFKKKPPSGWIKVKGSNWTIDRIIDKTVLINMINGLDEKIYQTDSVARWNLAYSTGLFGLYDELMRHNETHFRYLKACLDASLEESVQLIEFRRGSFGELFHFDSAGNEVSIDEHEELRLLTDFKNEYIQVNPRFIDFVFLIYGTRKNSREVIKSNLERTLSLQGFYPDFIRGFDLVGEEDLGHTLLFHRDSLIDGFNYTLATNHSFSLVFHAAETNWPDDVEPSQVGDDVSTLDNAFDAILLNTRRIGHGLGFVKYPHLYPYLKKREIAIEICPSSNQILGK
jgi:adenosine deaminase CECR1